MPFSQSPDRVITKGADHVPKAVYCMATNHCLTSAEEPTTAAFLWHLSQEALKAVGCLNKNS